MNSIAPETLGGKLVSEPLPYSYEPLLTSLFCGAGGLDVGFLNSGFSVLFAADNDKAAVSTYNKNHAGNRAQQVDILDLTAEELYERAIASAPEGRGFDGIVGGPPCQGFSRANVSRCHSDPRNQLAVKYADVVNLFHEKSGLKFFVFENVPEILAKKNKDFLTGLRERLGKNFNLYEKELNALNFGVPQVRRRYFIVGISKGLGDVGFSFPEAIGGGAKIVSDSLAGLPEPLFFSHKLKPEDIPFHPNHWTMRPRSQKFVTGEASSGGRSFIRLEWMKPSRTVAYGNREIHIHPTGKRRISIYEAMLLQGFAPEYVLTGNLSEQVKQVSNAVPPPVAQAIANSVKRCIYKGE